MKKFLLSLGVIVVFGGYAIYQHLNSAPAIMPITGQSVQSNQNFISQTPPQTTGSAITARTSSPPKTAASPGKAPTPAPISTPASSGKFKNGTYTGQVADAFYGNIQVAAVISGGKLTDVQILQYPNDRGHSIQINQQALPQLKSEAIAAQSSIVDIVSGATDTSQAFQQSLQSALSQAM